MGKKKSGKVLVILALLAWVFVVRFLTACSVEKDDLKKVRDLEFTVVGEADLPGRTEERDRREKGGTLQADLHR